MSRIINNNIKVNRLKFEIKEYEILLPKFKKDRHEYSVLKELISKRENAIKYLRQNKVPIRWKDLETKFKFAYNSSRYYSKAKT